MSLRARMASGLARWPARRRRRVGRLAQPLQVADREEPADARVGWSVVAVALHRRHVVGPGHALEADVAVGAHALEHVRLALVVEDLDELLRRAAHVAQVS